MSGIDPSDFQESYFNKTGKLPEAPPLERLSLGDIENMMQADDLWESFFKTYLPEASGEWESEEEALAKETEGSLSIKQRYQTTFNIYVTRFKEEYLDDSTTSTITVDGQTYETDQAVYGSSDKTVRVAMWNDYLKKSDIVMRHKAVYLWSITDLIAILQSLETTVINQSNGTLLFHRAQKNNIEEMSSKSFQKREKQGIPYDLIEEEGPIEHNGETSYQISILKAYAGKIQGRAEARSTLLGQSRSKYMNHNRAIGSLFSQLEALMDEFTK